MSGQAPLINQLHKIAQLRKRACVSDNELYEMMRSRQVYHVQTDLQKRLGETIRSLEHDRELALSSMLSRKLIFLKQVGKRDRKRKKLIDVKKHMDEILRDEDLEQLGSSHNEVSDAQRGETESSEFDGLFNNRRVRQPGIVQNVLKLKPINPLSKSDSTTEEKSSIFQKMSGIESGIELYLRSRDTSFVAAQRDKVRFATLRANTIASLVPGEQKDGDRIDVNNNSKNKFSDVKFHKDKVHSVLQTGANNMSENYKNVPHLSELLDVPEQFKKCNIATNLDFDAAETFRKVQMPIMREPLKNVSDIKHGESEKEKRKDLNDRDRENFQNGLKIKIPQIQIKPDDEKASTSYIQEHLYKSQLVSHDSEILSTKAKRDQSFETKGENGNQCLSLLKPSPPYLVSKLTKAPTNPPIASHVSSSAAAPHCERACMERTVTMIFVEDSGVEKPKSSFDVDAWLAFIRKKKGYSTTLNDGPLERESDEHKDAIRDSKQRVKFALQRKKLKRPTPPCKTCRERAMEWFREFNKSTARGKKHFATNKSKQSKPGRLPNLKPGFNSNISKRVAEDELRRLPRETTQYLLQRLRENTKTLQEKVHHLCADEYWKLWSNDNAHNA
ncbi:hypothetical protein PoB_006722700 [Plakobranchus ocellatus]|uniref:Uncharacterized protein n=1 Tax=Plakobranchus ocellatus TaxID=259542 RepID=A0AAV4D998_9GAST|nr:hypothetical protein PoB_006722700 [Plakobranchus ocellatus]